MTLDGGREKLDEVQGSARVQETQGPVLKVEGWTLKMGRGEVGVAEDKHLSFSESGPEPSLVGSAANLPLSLQAAKFSFLSSEDELEMIFDWVDVERKGRLSLEEFSSGLSMSVLGGPPGGCAEHKVRLSRQERTQ